MPALSHLDASGTATMVDVGDKSVTTRTARAQAYVHMASETLAAIVAGNAPKGDVLGTARIAGILAAKRTHELIPLCHPLLLTKVAVDFVVNEAASRIEITTFVRCSGQTGVEMEALTAASVAALTIYDMAKALDKAMTIDEICLLEKHGGKSGDYVRSSAREEEGGAA